jgi:hypothetical protein
VFRWAFAAILFIAALSFLLLGLASGRSRKVRHDLFTHENHWATVSAFNGKVYLLLNSRTDPGSRIPPKKIDLGSFQLSSTFHNPLRVTLLVAPFWLPSLLFVLLVGGPLFFLWRRRTCRRWAGHCPACGYSLTGLLEPRCPECGRETPAPVVGRIHRILISRTVATALLLLALLPIGGMLYPPVRKAIDRKESESAIPPVVTWPAGTLALLGWEESTIGTSRILVSPDKADSILIGPDGTIQILSGSRMEGIVERINKSIRLQPDEPPSPGE